MADRDDTPVDEVADDAPRVAIIGMAGRFPGAPDVDTYWRNVHQGAESVRRFTRDELLAAGESPDRLADPAYVPACPVLEGVESFDAGFFGWSPREAAITDPQHRVFLETAWHALENAGHDPARFSGAVGVFAACGMPAYMMHHLVTNQELMENVGEWLLRHTGNDMNFLATRASYEMNLRGPSMNVQTACSSSLVAVHMAAQSLLAGECDMALAGASTVVLPQDRGYLFKEGEIMSPDGHCRPFDADSQGTLFGSGVGCVVMRRLDDALADGDRVLAILRGSAINNDGAQKVGFLAPSVDGQTQVIAEALGIAGLDAGQISYVEAHGTGTAIGDPIEVKALAQAFAGSQAGRGSCALGSVKANLGHLGEAAGMAALIKMVRALQARIIPPTINFARANPEIDLVSGPFYVPTSAQPWTSSGPRRAGITALGAGGTNAHVILEEAPAAEPAAAGRPWQLLALSAKSTAALDAATTNLAAALRAPADDRATGQTLADVAYTLATGRQAFAHRRVVVARDAADAAMVLEGQAPTRLLTRQRPKNAPKVVFMLPGGGAQYAGMGEALYRTEPAYARIIDEAAALCRPKLGLDLRTLLLPPEAERAAASKKLEAPSLALPALLATEYALATLLMARGIEPEALIGHSMGEYVAACLSGVMSFADALAMVALRGKLFETLAPGSMLSVALPEAEVRARIASSPATSGLSIAAVNGPALCVASGASDAITALEATLVAREINCTRIHIAVPAHSQMLAPILPAFEAFCRTLTLRPPQRRYISNLTGTWITAAQAVDPRYWVDHLRHPVRFSEGLATLLREPGGSAGTVLVEVGPGRTLASLARQQGVTPAPEAIPTLPHPTELESADAFLLGALGRLWLAGADLKWEVFVDGERRQRVALPGYPFQRARHWVARGATNTATASAGGAAASEARGPLTKVPEIADWYWRPTWQAQALGTNGASATNAANASNATAGAVAPAWLLFVDDRGVGAALAQRLKARGEAVVTVAAGTAYAATGPDAFTLPPGARAAYVQLWEALRTRPVPPRAIVHLWNVGERAGASYDSLLWLLQALAGDEQPAALTIVSAGLHSIAGEAVPAPDKALLLGPCLVAPRELPWLRTRAVDLPVAASADGAGAWQRERIVESLLAEVDDLRRADAGQVGDSSGSERVVALRPGGRFVRAFERQRLESSGPSLPAGLRAGGTYLITGGLGGVGLEIAAWLARVAAARLVLLGRSPVPAPSDRPAWLASHGSDHPTSRLLLRLQEMEGTAGIAVLVARADVRDAAAVRAVVEQARARFGRIDGVFHAAGTIDDGLLQLKEQGATDDLVIASKVEGARSLDAALADQPPDLFVLFSSVSSFMGFEGQIDYAAANAFLDAFAEARNARAPGYTVAVNFSAWRDVGMAVRLADRFAEQAHAHGPETRWLPEVVTDTDAQFVVSGMFRRDRDWVLREHVVRDGDRSVMPGTGFVELTRAAAEAAEEKSTNPLGALVLQDLVFVAPLVVAGAEARRLTVSINRSDGQLTIASSAAADAGGMVTAQTHVVGRVAARESGPTPARVDLDAVRARCPGAQPVKERQLDQDFMRFGPRWANLDRIGIGSGEALVDLRLDDAFTGDLSTVPLHPALLDMATGGAQTLIPGFDRHRDFYVPFSYGRVVVHRGLTARLHSHVRHKTAAAGDTAAFDVTLCDSDGAVLVTVTDFVMKRLPASQGAFAATGAAVSATPAGASAATLREAALLHGMTPPEGIEALHRVLARRPGAQIVVSSVDIRRWRAQVDAEAQASAARSVPAATSAISAAGAGAAERPALAAAYVAPTDEWQRLVAGVWQTILGIGGIGIHDNFFELGGHSLLLTQAATRVRKAAGLDLPLSTLFSKLTIAELAADLQRASAAAAGAAPSKVAPLRAVSRDAYRTKRPAVAGGETGGPPPVAATPIPTAPDQKKPEAS